MQEEDLNKIALFNRLNGIFVSLEKKIAPDIFRSAQKK